MTAAIEDTIASWQADRHVIGMVEFAPSDAAAEQFPYYALPDGITFLGVMEVDAVCLCADGAVRVYDNAAENRILCCAAADQSSFVAAMQELERHWNKCASDESYRADMAAAARVRDRCAQLAGGDPYMEFFTSLLGL